ncbi:class I SAM-dependent methyltransferase [Flexivirga sp. ID2601S]|uniref:Class I SAM-dependent methyltransferase n=1 Tax=Flexivirga aerilata TaxID=1656889 RepID=A0A849AP43_9MICO|nr:class I SAM-dependent methyltransferase [Flexivirga aerilata]NNG41181.1 class I SAM-dependent methyltransferase [Flexivirga aerilata]
MSVRSSVRSCEICGGPTAAFVLRGGATLHRCARCGHLLRDLDAAPAGHRDHAYGGEPTLDRWRLALTYRLLASGPAPRSVFEIGYGTGSMLRRFLDAGAAVAGADPDQLELAVDPEVRRRGDLHATGVEQVDTDRVRADLVYGIHVLEHVTDPLRTLQVAADLLEPGGTAQFLTPAGDSDGLRLYGQAWWMLEDPTHVRFFTAESLRRAATSVGLVDVRITRPALDSLTTDVGSLTRMLRPRPRPHGVLGERPVLFAGMASAPLVLAARAARPALRPTLHLTARKPA